ncbi:hypothetical protein WR25_00930 [Diploscapter pachys]|uniref:C2H2-type domain-containing protein n=1 Tax=Diploscapter pachys TaxID=2018661 RepID=A0A2A2KVS5_9BILA|nr:hypothetical protein WR25_00930 [Diploscapter pachys]
MEVNVFPEESQILSLENDSNCEKCNRKFTNSSAYRLHNIRVHGIVESEGDKRIQSSSYNKNQKSATFIYHCPVPDCRDKNVKYNGMRYLRQHYLRVHSEKQFSCDKCSYKTGLRKDLLYHKKKRCTMREKHAEDNAEQKKSLKRKMTSRKDQPESSNISEQEPTSSSFPLSSNQAIIIVVPTENVGSILEDIKKSICKTNGANVEILNMPSTSQINNNQMDQQMNTNPSMGPTQSYLDYEEPYFYNGNAGNGLLRMNRATAVEPHQLQTQQQGQGQAEPSPQQQQQQHSGHSQQRIRTLSAYTQVSVPYYMPHQQHQSAQYDYQPFNDIPVSSSSGFTSLSTEMDKSALIRDESSFRNAGTSMEDPLDLGDYYRNIQTQTAWGDGDDLLANFPDDLGC